MADDGRQTTLDASTGDVSGLERVDWTFADADTTYLTHGLHSYPARMIPQIPDALFDYYLSAGVIEPGDRVYDPFSGSGTTAVEARLHGLHAEGNDINPLACVLGRTKATPLDASRLQSARSELVDGLRERLRDVRRRHAEGTLAFDDEPEVRDGWFPEPQLQELWQLRQDIERIESAYDREVGRFFRIVLSAITRQVSYQRNGEYKRYRIAEEDRDAHDPDVYDRFQDELDKSVKRMRSYSERVDASLDTIIHYADSRTATANDDAVAPNSADIVITSPPYGDHRTTVAYGQFSQDPAIIADEFGYDEMKAVDKTGLGGADSGLDPVPELEEWSPAFGATMDALRERDGRASDAMRFVRDYYEVIEEVAEILKPGQPAAWVVANRTMSRVNVPTHLITRELCEYLGYDHEVTLPREIPSKTLPWANAPENIEGVTGELMAEENIVIVRAPS